MITCNEMLNFQIMAQFSWMIFYYTIGNFCIMYNVYLIKIGFMLFFDKHNIITTPSPSKNNKKYY